MEKPHDYDEIMVNLKIIHQDKLITDIAFERLKGRVIFQNPEVVRGFIDYIESKREDDTGTISCL